MPTEHVGDDLHGTSAGPNVHETFFVMNDPILWDAETEIGHALHVQIAPA